MSDFNKKRNLKEHLEGIKNESVATKKHLLESIINEIYPLIEEAIFSVSLNHSFSSGVILIPSNEDFFIEGQNNNDKNPAFTTRKLIKYVESSLKDSGITVQRSEIGGSFDDYDDWNFEKLPRPRKMEFCLRIDIDRVSEGDIIIKSVSQHKYPILKSYRLATREGAGQDFFICDATEDWYWSEFPDYAPKGGLHDSVGPYSMLRIIT